MYNKVADSSDVVIQERGFSIVDTHEPEFAMPLSPFCYMTDTYSYEIQIFPVGHHQEAHLFVPPGLHHITSVSSHCGVSRNERHTSILFGSFLPSPASILCHQRAFKIVIYWDQYPGVTSKLWRCEGGAGVWWGDPMRGTPFS